jgi:hypothetical protein
MEGNVWRPRYLTSEQMEERRLVAATLLHQGQLSQADIARHVCGGQPRQCLPLGRHPGPRGPARSGRATHPGTIAPPR